MYVSLYFSLYCVPFLFPSQDEGKAESTQGRFLRSGRTIPEREMISEPPSPLSVGGDRYQNDGDFNELDWDSAR